MIIKQGDIASSRDLLKLQIVDWNRLLGYWDTIPEAAESIASWLVASRARYSIIQCDMNAAPKRSDWPGWKHIGDHPEIGERFWNWFHWKQRGKLYFSDSPDFHGVLQFPDSPGVKFYGDVGLVSAPTFIRSIKLLDAYDAWITIVDTETQIMIEPVGSIRQLWDNFFSHTEKKEKIDHSSKPTQLSLF